MERLTSFSFEKHEGAYESWPTRTRLFFDGEYTGRRFYGYVIEAQFRVGSRYLLVTTDDCPFEEITRFQLLDESFRLLSRRSKGWAYTSWSVRSVKPRSESSFVVEFTEAERWILTVRPRRPFGLGSYLGLERMEADDGAT